MGKIEQKAGKVSFVQSLKDYFIGYVDFKGRTTRAGYWWVTLILSIISFALLTSFLTKIISAIIAISNYESDYDYLLESQLRDVFADSVGLLILLVVLGLATFLPTLAMTVRRYRDAGLRGRGTLTIYIIFIICGMTNLSGNNLFFAMLVLAIDIFFFVLTVLATGSLETTSSNAVLLFFFRKKQTAIELTEE
ncbi:DUF805 domain-containing protein [Enterococcus quebecensis]|uniref:DUF805 domain-containing protein n=1 Tax=Enterococcus quebecensis TaxID=903983 RepID=A0A1E5GTT1_9ENTE|nr:DUF805 domain-containing protein [Enterococcus quebecensis]OEG16067.1 hypothetical protein BCR23_07935 [Enterococcus quebecensis]OJG75049.1 hypothetical protein RV12_GL002094 [Enterococcus quebecensis]